MTQDRAIAEWIAEELTDLGWSITSSPRANPNWDWPSLIDWCFRLTYLVVQDGDAMLLSNRDHKRIVSLCDPDFIGHLDRALRELVLQDPEGRGNNWRSSACGTGRGMV